MKTGEEHSRQNIRPKIKEHSAGQFFSAIKFDEPPGSYTIIYIKTKDKKLAAEEELNKENNAQRSFDSLQFVA